MKKFYNNTLIGGAFSKALRVIALLCVLLGVSTSAWAWDNELIIWNGADNNKYYHDISNGSCTVNLSSAGDYYFFIKDNKDNGKEKKLSGDSQMSNGNSTDWKFDGTNSDCGLKVNNGETGNFTFKLRWDNSTPVVSVVYPVAASTTYHANYPWDNGDWYFKDFDANNQITGKFYAEGMDIGTSGGSTTYYIIIKNGTLSNGTPCTFTWNPTAKTVTATPIGGGGGGSDEGDCDTPETFYLVGNPVGGWDGYFTEMQPTEDGKGHYYVIAKATGGFKMNITPNWDSNGDWWKSVKVSSGCSTITYDGQGGDANLNASNVYIKFNPCTKYIWTEPIECTTDPVFTTPDNFTLSLGESVDLKNICTSTSDANITFTRKSGTSATLSGSTLTAGQTAGTVVIKATQPLKTPYCSGSVEFSVNVVEKSIVILAEDAKENQDKSWTLSAYLEMTDCKYITEYGFVLCGSTTKGDCTPTYTSKDIILSTEGNLEKGAHFTDNVLRSQLTSDWYAYRAFVKHGEEEAKHSEIRYFSLCNNVFGDTIYVTIDNSLTNDNKCDFRFKSFENAWTALEGYKDICTVKNVNIGNQTQKSFTLLKPIVMQVVPTNDAYQGSEAVGLTGGDKNDVLAIFFRNINMNGGEPLIVRSIDKTATKATLLHVTIRRSKNITLDYLNITGSSKNVSTADNALDIDDGNGTGNREGLGGDWNTVTLGAVSDAKITIKNCGITSSGFTCVHVSAYDGITFENNEIKALYDFVAAVNESHGSYTNQANNTAHWGASAKFLNSKNIKFVRNNFTGQHATSILLQGSQSVLVYNNVFWHDNGVQSDVNTVAIIRLVSYCSDNPLQNIGIYYNTMFLKNNEIGYGKYHHFDFFRLGGNLQNERHGNYKPTTIEFDYNNCYSYDKDVYGKNYTGSNEYTSDDSKTHYLQSLEESDWCSSFKYNNFWSVYEEELANKPTKSAFELGSGCGTENSFTNVKNLVCKTAPEEPGSLVIKGNALNRGSYIQTDVSGLLTTDMQKIDRLGNDRPYKVGDNVGDGKYTIGAYQQSEGSTLNQIIWHGSASDEWDNRNNWYKPNGQLVTCVDILDENLEVILPAPYSTKKQYLQPVTGIQHYPTLPSIVEDSDFSTARSKEWFNEEVTAGKGHITKPTQIANKITMEYGAALIGVEQLAKEGKTRRYETVSNEFVAERDKWLLVGTVVKPYNEDTEDDATDTRYIKSGDYYLDHLPAVYMRDAIISGEESSWNATFRDMDKYVVEKTVYAVKLPDQYGPYKLPAADYNFNNHTNYDPTQAHAYNFEGRFVNEANTPKYIDLAVGSYNLLVNTYPANIKVSEIKGGSVLIYDFNGGSFRTPGWTAANGENTSLILAQHGFAYKPTSSPILEIPSTAFEESNTMHRSAQVELPEIRVMVKNDKYPFNSDVKISIDELKADAADPNVDASKLFTKTENKVPELYVIKYNEQWAGITLPNMDECIPLGLRMLAKNQTVTFSLNKVNGIDVAILEDRLEGKQYDLLAGETCTVSGLVKGDCEGRFFLNLGVSEDDTEEGDENVSTDVEDELSSESGIMIFGNTEGIVVSCSSDIELQTIYVNDMSGKTAKYNVSGQYAEIKLPVATGVYTVNVIGDTASKVGKVILK